MSEFFMGAELGASELPIGSPVPQGIPPEGVIIPKIESDGWTRKYLHQMGRNPICIAEIPPKPGPSLAGSTPIPFEESVPLAPTPVPVAIRTALQAMSPIPVSQPVRVPVPNQHSPFMMGGPVQIRMPEGPMQARVGLGTPVANLTGQVALARYPIHMGQTIPSIPAPAPGTPLPTVQPNPPDPDLSNNPSDPTCGICPAGPLQLPDGKIVQLDDPITLRDLCEMLPAIMKNLPCGPGGAPAAAPQPYGQGPIPVQKMNGAGFPGFGPASGVFGQGGGGGGGGGGLPGPLGVVNQAIPQGGQGQGGPGPTGPVGPPGAGTAIDFVTKTDGNFTAGPGGFIPVPGTLFSFQQGADGNVIFLLNAVFGCDQATNDALGIRIDGGPAIPLQANLFQVAAPVAGFFQGATAMWPQFLAAGQHTVEVMLRGIGAGEFCAASGLGLSATLGATPDTPLSLAILHSTVGVAPPTAPLLVVDGIVKDDANFTNAGAPSPITGLSLNINVVVPGKAYFAISGNVLTGGGVISGPLFILGVNVDGTDYPIARRQILNLAGDIIPLTGTIPIDLAAGPHVVQGIYSGGTPGVHQLIAAANSPVTLTVIHP